MTALMGTLLLFFACGRASSPRTSIAQSRSSYDAPIDTPSPSDPAQQPFVVPPELAIISARLSTTQPSFAAATQLLQEKTDRLLSDVNAGSFCGANILDYRQPVPPLDKYFRWDADQYTSQIDVEIEVSFEGVTAISERIQRLDDCIQRIPEFATVETKKEEAIAMALSPALPTIQDPTIHREALLLRQFAPLQAVADAAQPPSQFTAIATQCTSNGDVKIVGRSLSGIELAVDFECHRDGFASSESLDGPNPPEG